MKAVKIAVVAALGVSSLTGCMGQMATTGLVSKFNLEIVDNRYGREGMFLLLSPVYGLAGTIDLFIFNAIEFWTGTNPVSGKSPAVVDTPTKNYIKVNGQLDPALTSVPLARNSDVENATMKQIDDNTLQMNITYRNGEQKVLRGEKGTDSVDFYLDDELITTVSNQELNNYITAATI
ncbi:DUF3332 domain-containing protein [Vibrio sp. 404]|uniref:DUF3332 domain-containing protein n=1 Tax=Vibrio marinisediminis TaxID=2758441 RepID=A0A7W2FTM4_9VIBR|nr:DUF3332 domain-containing protein [Vibrio marinisediminis]MBA5764023.1 DUF3332 domain-containing protein [Vibrio marinisediminis]